MWFSPNCHGRIGGHETLLWINLATVFFHFFYFQILNHFTKLLCHFKNGRFRFLDLSCFYFCYEVAIWQTGSRPRRRTQEAEMNLNSALMLVIQKGKRESTKHLTISWNLQGKPGTYNDERGHDTGPVETETATMARGNRWEGSWY